MADEAGLAEEAADTNEVEAVGDLVEIDAEASQEELQDQDFPGKTKTVEAAAPISQPQG